MQRISWIEAQNLALKYQELGKISLFVFTDEECEVCSSFVPMLSKLENQYYQVFEVIDGKNMPFPIQTYPMGYVYIPNCPTKMPLLRVGNAPIEILEEDCSLQITAFLKNQDYYKIKDDYLKARKTKSS